MATCLVGLGKALGRAGRHTEAADCFERAIGYYEQQQQQQQGGGQEGSEDLRQLEQQRDAARALGQP